MAWHGLHARGRMHECTVTVHIIHAILATPAAQVLEQVTQPVNWKESEICFRIEIWVDNKTWINRLVWLGVKIWINDKFRVAPGCSGVIWVDLS